ncbi:hypothetical protein [Nocardioides campestrisoli]|uniref:hypothetical protein n=1 Tax=Nocardioides campestrisoli TaxID=2736757 RepID=UPI0015E646A1|nr:hypothetical protein [Nocardioides campestrisoli]
MSTETPRRHPFEPTLEGEACRVITAVVAHRPVECGAAPGDPIHTGTRPAPPELEHRAPLCPMCHEETSHDGDSWLCQGCEASWDDNGRGGSWFDEDLKVCDSTFKPFDNPNLELRYESIRHHVVHCSRAVDEDGEHDGKHRTLSAVYAYEWVDEQALGGAS